VVEGARLESVCRGNLTEGSNPSLSAMTSIINNLIVYDTIGDTDIGRFGHH
jgi:hypothetical protein